MSFLIDYKKAFKAEWLKLKGSGMFWLTLIMAAFIPAIFTLAGLLQSDSGITSVNTANPWKELIGNCFQAFGSFFFPIFLTLVVIRLTQMEHSGGGWKLIETQPISKAALYLGKFSMAIIVAYLCLVALALFSLLSGTTIMLAKGVSGFSNNPIPLDFIFGLSFRFLISGLGILGIQFLFSVVISGFLIPFGIGLAATITGVILLGFGQALWWPYTSPMLTGGNPDGSATGNFLLYYEWLSIGWMIVALLLGYQWYQRKNLKRAFFKPATRLAYLFIPIAAFALFFWYINKPVQLPSHNRTVISGTFESIESIQKVFLISESLMDTVLEIPVEKNSFKFIAEKNILPVVYFLKAGSMNPQKIFFGSGDSLHIDFVTDGKSSKFTAGGNRLPENEFIKRGIGSNNYQLYYLENFGYEMKPNVFAAEIKQQWNKEIDRIDSYKTADNLKPSDNFISMQKKLASLRYLHLLDLKFPQWFKVYHPKDTLKFPASIDTIRNTVSYKDSSLMSYAVYKNFLKEYYEQTYKLNSGSDTAYLSKTCRALPMGAIRDHLITNRIKEAIGRTRDISKRESLLAAFIPAISQPKLQQQLLSQHNLIKSLSFGMPAPDFKTTALNKDSFSLKDFKGRYVVIDVWATWCTPCKIESPNFERIAELNTNPKLAFVALSIDDNHNSWKNESNDRSSRVLQLIANDKDGFGKSFGIETIPRFMLIGPDGRIINIQMPYPGEAEFEEILNKAVSGSMTFQAGIAGSGK